MKSFVSYFYKNAKKIMACCVLLSFGVHAMDKSQFKEKYDALMQAYARSFEPTERMKNVDAPLLSFLKLQIPLGDGTVYTAANYLSENHVDLYSVYLCFEDIRQYNLVDHQKKLKQFPWLVKLLHKVSPTSYPFTAEKAADTPLEKEFEELWALNSKELAGKALIAFVKKPGAIDVICKNIRVLKDLLKTIGDSNSIQLILELSRSEEGVLQKLFEIVRAVLMGNEVPKAGASEWEFLGSCKSMPAKVEVGAAAAEEHPSERTRHTARTKESMRRIAEQAKGLMGTSEKWDPLLREQISEIRENIDGFVGDIRQAIADQNVELAYRFWHWLAVYCKTSRQILEQPSDGLSENRRRDLIVLTLIWKDIFTNLQATLLQEYVRWLDEMKGRIGTKKYVAFRKVAETISTLVIKMCDVYNQLAASNENWAASERV